MPDGWKKIFAGKRLYTLFIPALLWGDPQDASAVETRRVYRPTAAQLRLEQQNREQTKRILAIRKQQAAQAAAVRKAPVRAAAGKTAAAPAASAASAVPASAAAPVAPAAPRIRYIWYQSSRFVLAQDVARYYGMKVYYLKNGMTMKSARDTVFLQYGKRLAYLNQIAVYLNHAPLLRGSLVYLDEKDFLLAVDPVVRNAPLWKHPVKTVLLDPGHGGKDQGAPGARGVLEKNVTLSIAKRLAVKMQKRGYRVFMTRIADRQLTLQQRVDMCEKLKPDLFVSVHCNAVGKGAIQGIETYALTPQGAASTSDSKPVNTSSAGNSFNRNNCRLAYEVQKNLLSSTRAEDRGVRHARFFVIRHAVCPAILIETGFLTHAKECASLNSPAYQEKVADGILNGIAAYEKAAALPAKAPVPARKPAPAASRKK